MSWMIIFPRGDRTTLKCAQVDPHERDEYALASRAEYDETESGLVDCTAYMVELAKRHGLQYVLERGQHAYLD